MAEFLVALADFDRRRLWQSLGFSSLFHFLHRELGMSKGAAHYRKTAAELIQRVPDVVEPLRDGRLCITSIIELAKVLTPENRGDVLPRFFHRSRQEAKAVSAEIAPMEAAPNRTVVTALAAPAAALGSMAPPRMADSVLWANAPNIAAGQREQPHPPPPVQPVELAQPKTEPRPAPRASAEPLTADLRRMHVTVSKRFMEKLDAARDALSHSHPGADVQTLLEAGLDLVLERAAKRKGLVKKPRSAVVWPPDGAAEVDPRHVPAAVRREVFIRDEARCQWGMADGGICGSTHRLELDHVVPVGRGGRSTVGNLRVLCDFHNGLAAREAYGNAWMDRFTGRGQREADSRANGAS